MVTLISNSALLSKPPYPPIRTVASTSPSDSLSTAFAPRLTKLFWGWSRSQTRLRVRNLSPVPNFTVTCGTGISEINETQFSETVLKSNRPVLVEFVATWCGPCRLISPAIEWVAQEYGDRLSVVKIDHDTNPQLIKEFKVYGLPALILFKDGKEVPESRREGAISKAKLKEYLDALLELISVA